MCDGCVDCLVVGWEEFEVFWCVDVSGGDVQWICEVFDDVGCFEVFVEECDVCFDFVVVYYFVGLGVGGLCQCLIGCVGVVVVGDF